MIKTHMSTPLVSIVILSALRFNSTRACLKSIARHTKDIDYEIIIIDMGLDNKIKRWLLKTQSKDKRIRVILNHSNIGISAGRNQGLKLASGNFVVFMDNDIIVQNSWLKKLLFCAARRKNAAAFGSKLICRNNYVYFCDKYLFDRKINGRARIGIKVIEPLKKTDPRINAEKIVPWYPTGCLMVKTKTMKQLGGFDEKLPFVEEDKDLCLRIRKAGKQIVYCPGSSVIHHRIQDNQYDNKVRYRNLKQIKKNIVYFEKKWSRRVDLIYSLNALRRIGYSDVLIQNMRNGELKEFFTII